MLKLEEVRYLYPEYNDMTDYELSSAMHRTRYADMPYEQFAKQFGGPLQEDDRIVKARAYNEKHPDTPINAEEIGEGSFSADMGRSFMQGVNELGALPFWGAEKFLEGIGLDSLASYAGKAKDWYKNKAEEWGKSTSADMKLSAEKEFIHYDPEQGYSIGDAWTDPRKIGASIAQSLPSMAAGQGIAFKTAARLASMGLSKALAWAIGSSIGEGSVAGAQDSMGAYDAVMEMPEEKLEQSPEYQELLRQMGPAEARKALADNIAMHTGIQTGLATGALSAPAGALFGKMLGGETGKTLARSMGKMAASEGAEEALQSGAEAYLQKRQEKRADPGINPITEVPNAMAEGLMAGAAMGGGLGPVGHYRGKIARRNDEVANNEDETQLDVGQAKPEEIRPADPLLNENIDSVVNGLDETRKARMSGLYRPNADDNALKAQRIQEDLKRLETEENERQQRIFEAYRGTRQNTEPGPLPLPDWHSQIAEGLAGARLPVPSGSINMGMDSTGYSAMAPDNSFGGETIAPPYIEPLYLPDETGMSAGSGIWPGGKSQLSYPYGTRSNRNNLQDSLDNGDAIDLLQDETGAYTLAQGLSAGFNSNGDSNRRVVKNALHIPNSNISSIAASPNLNVIPSVSLPTPTPMPGQSQITNTQQAPRADTQAMAEGLGMPAPQAIPQEARTRPDIAPVMAAAQAAGNGAAMQADPAFMRGLKMVESAPTPQMPAGGITNVGQEAGFGLSGLQQGYGGRYVQQPAGHEAGPAEGRDEESRGETAKAAGGRNRRKIKIPNRPDEEVSFEVMEADDVHASHIPEAGFQANPRFQLENERRYHDEPASQAKVLNNAQGLDPSFLMESVDANHGAPVVDRQGNVLGGNGRAMSVRMAYEKFPRRAREYRQAIRSQAESLGVDPARIDGMKRPVLVRRLARDMDAGERQSLVSALNDTFTDSKNTRAAGKSRGDRLKPKTLEALGRGLGEADSLRDYFDQPESAEVVEMLINDGVIQNTERNALVGRDGLLNHDGKRAVEEALRGRIARSYEALDSLPTPVLGKIDAAIPYILIAENVGGEWNITGHMRDAIDLMAEFQSRGEKSLKVFFDQADINGQTTGERYSDQAKTLFLMMRDARKKAFTEAFAKYAAQAKLSTGGMNLAMSAEDAGAVHLDLQSLSRLAMIRRLPKEMQARARRSTNQQIREMLAEYEAAKDKAGEEKQEESEPFGKAYPEYSGKPEEAIEYLLKVKEGYVPAAFNKERIGDIDVPWGKDGKGGFGVAHIIERRNKDGQDGIQFVRRLPNIIDKGSVEKRENSPGRLYIVAKDGNAEAVISLSYHGKDRAWLLTGYEYKNTPLERQSDDRLSTADLSDEQHIPSSHSKGAETNISPQTPESNRNYGTIENPNTIALGDYFAEQFEAGKRYATIGQARREAGQLLHGRNNIPPEQYKTIDEAIELGVVRAARKTVDDMRREGRTDREIYRALVDLYRRQPNLSSRTTTSMREQAYSTPAPIAFLASRLAGINEKTTVFEPTAGNGMLLMEASPENVVANELNAGRAERLRSQGFEVTEQDAVQFRPKDKVDVVIGNPPFGRVWDEDHTATIEMEVDGFATRELDQAIVARSLQAMKGNGQGRAVLIIGGERGNDASRKRGYRANADFWRYLSQNYNIRDHFSLEGKLYSRQGAGFPIDVIVLDNQGRTGDYIFPGGKPPRVYSSFEELEGLLDESGDSARVSAGNTPERGREGSEGGEQRTAAQSDRGAAAEPVQGRDRRGGDGRGESGLSDGNGQGDVAGTAGERPGAMDRSGRDSAGSNGQKDRGDLGNDAGRGAEGKNNDAGVLERGNISADAQGRGGGPGRNTGQPGELGTDNSVGLVERRPAAPKKEKVLKPTQYQTPYQKTSSLPSLGTLVPKNMATAVRNAFAAFRKEHGDIDKFVAKELGYKEGDLGNYFAAEQVDAIGLAIHNLKKGSGFIIGDQTGIGKGRVNAAIIRWANRQGMTPVFITMNPQLYGDMMRDLQDIGMDGFTPLPTNNLTGSDAIDLPDGRKLKTASRPKHKATLEKVMADGLGEEYDAIFTTYSQLDSTRDNFRRRFVEAIAPGALFILDEAHNAGGTQKEERKAKDAPLSRAKFIRELLKKSPNGVFYSSATYAKRPDVMDLYMKTDMRHAVNDGESLGEAINRGGIPMQQIVAAQLAESGQYLRRERTWEGADVETLSVKTDTKRADACADAMRAIMDFDRVKQERLQHLKDQAAGAGLDVADNSSANESGMSSIGFSSVMHNLIAQSTLSQKIEAIIGSCKKALDGGEKPVITLSNTMGSAIEEYAEANGIAVGDPISITFEDMFLRYLEKTRTIKRSDGKKIIEERLLTDAELGPEGTALYKRAGQIIRQSGVNQLPVSFIDKIADGLRREGISVGEITGRNVGIDYSGDTPVLARRGNTTSDKIRTVNGFNSGALDVVILNSAGSTGISLHASEKFRDQRRRAMIVAQPDLNIDVFMQTLGRVFRTGQVVPPRYQLLFTDIPAEKRQAAVLAKKMASLNANTSAAKDSDATFRNIPDFMNKYGDRVAMQIMAENPALHEKMGAPLEKKEGSRPNATEGAMQKLTGYIPLLPVSEQTQIYDQLQAAYGDLIKQLEAMGALDLEARNLPLDAKLLNEEEIAPKKDDVDGESPFAASARLGKYDVKKLGKPLPVETVRELEEKGEGVDASRERENFDSWLKKKLKDVSPKKRADFRDRAENSFELFRQVADTYAPGVPVLLENQNDGQRLAGLVTNVFRKGRTDNPVALSAFHVEIAVADASRKLTFPFSQISNPSMNGYTFEPYGISREAFYTALEEGQSEGRETAYIATGNILAAYERLNTGRVVVFEDHDGNLVPGLMLSKGTNIGEVLGNIDVVLTPEHAVDFLNRLAPGKAAVKTEDGNLIAMRTDDEAYQIAVPASKAKGAAYFFNGEILKAAGKDFVKSGNSMVLRNLSREQFRAVLDAMNRQGTGLIADNNKDTARHVSGQKPISEKAFASIKPGEYLPPRNSARKGIRAAAVKRVAETLGELARNAAPVRVVQSFGELPQKVREMFGDNASQLDGAYDAETDMVWMVADKIESTARAAEVWAHEQIVHHGLRGMLSEHERKKILNELFSSLGGMGNPLIKQIAEAYGLKPRSSLEDRLTVMEETLAHLAESKRLDGLTGSQESMWQKIVRAVMRAWNRLVEKVSGRQGKIDHEQVDSLLTALGRFVIDGVPAGGVQTQAADAMASMGEEQTNSYGIPESRVTQIEGKISKEEVQAALEELAGKDLPNLIEGLTAQVNSNQRGKLISEKARRKSREDGFTSSEHSIAAQKIANIWKWSAEMRGVGGSKEKAADVNIRRFISPVRVNGRDAFAWLTVKETSNGLRIYSLQLMNNKKLREQVGNVDADTSSNTPTRSFEEIIDRLKGPVKDRKPLASLGLRDILNLRTKDAAKLANEPEIERLFKSNDLTIFQTIVQLPHWIAKQFKEFAEIYERQLRRMDERSAALMKSLEQVPLLFGKNRLGKDDMDSLKKLLWKLEGAETKLESESGVSKFVVDGKLENGRTKLAINPKFYDVYQEVLDAEEATAKAKEAMMQIRKSLDNDLLLAFNRMSAMSEIGDDVITKLRENIGHVPNYFPHHRYGKYFVQARNKDGVVYRQHFDALNRAMAEARAKEIAREQGANFPDAKWSVGDNSKLPDDVLGAPIDSEAMEQIIRTATSKIGDKALAEKINSLLTSSVADVLKTRGWGSHGIQRKGIPGYEQEDIVRVLYDYKSGLIGWLTKIDAARDFSRALGKIDASRQPRLWQYASQYVKDMLRNADGIDRTVGKIKSVAFAWYLGMNIKTAFVNLTQNLVVGIPRLQMDVTGGGRFWLKGAQDALVNQVTGGQGKGLTADEQSMIQELYDQQVITDAFMEEVRGHMDRFSRANAWNKFTKFMGWPMSMVERFNRASLALAAYRAARRGALRQHAFKKYGINGKATHEQAVRFATEIVRDAHFVYGKSNVPEFMRSNTAGRALSAMYTFRSFSHNMLNMWAWALRTQGREGAMFTAKSIGATMALGGVTALPLYATLMALCQMVTGDDDDWTEVIRDSLPNDNMLRDVVCYGMPAAMGVNIGGSLKMETPISKGLSKGGTPEKMLVNSIGDIVGIPYDLVVRPSKVLDAVDKGNYWRAVEEAVPTFAKNGMQAWRLYWDGQTTVSGRPINSPGEKGARKLTLSEAAGKFMGFQPVSSTKSYESYAADQRRDAVKSNKINEIVVLALRGRDSGDMSYQRKAIKEMEKWNERMKSEGKPGMMFNWKDVMRRVKSRRRENSNNARQKARGARQREVWGV